MKLFYLRLCACVLVTITLQCTLYAAGNNAAYEQRQLDYRTTALSNFDPDAITIQAYQGLPVDQAALDTMLSHVNAHEVVDFDLVKLVRIMCLDSGKYESTILPVVYTTPFWLRSGELYNNYWSENHMIMWMSSDWLLHERYNKTIDSTLDSRLRHFLRLKVQYGYYEFFSSVYSPYCLSGLLNLADFAHDAEIKDLATQASRLLLARMLMLTNDKGTYFPTAGRNYYGKYESAYGQNHSSLIWMLTGLGQQPTGATHCGAFLATSTLPVDTIINSRTTSLDTLLINGHPFDSIFAINAGQAHVDKMIFQWSCGGYFYPSVAVETAQLLTDSNLWDQADFSQFNQFQSFPINNFGNLAESASCISKSSVISGENIAIFKNNSITLSSVQDFWKGKVGFQEFPCVANVGTTAVFTASGKVKPSWESRSDNNANNDLPYVQQKKNVALLMYRPEKALTIFGYKNPEVSLFWHDADFDEMREDSLWLLGRQGNSYVGVRRSCIDSMNGWRYCPTTEGQTWVLMVGDSSMYGSFNNFQEVIDQSQYQEDWYYDSLNAKYVYHARIDIDTMSLEYAWGVDSVTTGITEMAMADAPFTLLPNPTNDKVQVDLSAFNGGVTNLAVIDLLGRVVYSKQQETATHVTIDAGSYAKGVYLVVVENGGKRFVRRLVKE